MCVCLHPLDIHTAHAHTPMHRAAAALAAAAVRAALRRRTGPAKPYFTGGDG